MRFYPEGQKEFSLEQAMEGLMVGGLGLVRLAGRVDDPALTANIGGRLVPYFVEMGTAYPPVSEKAVQDFFAQPGIQDKLKQSLRLLQEVQTALLHTLNFENMDLTEDIVARHVKRQKKAPAAK